MTDLYITSAYGVIIRNYEHETLQKISKKFTYGEEQIDDDLPASDILDGEIDLERLDGKFPGLSADVAGELQLGMNRSLVVFIQGSSVHINIDEAARDAWKLPAFNVTKSAKKSLKEFCKKYNVGDEPGWITWSTAR